SPHPPLPFPPFPYTTLFRSRIAILLLPLYLSVCRRLRDGATEDVDRIAAGDQGHHGALGGLATTVAVAGALELALTVSGVDAGDLHAEDLLDGNLDLGLVGRWCDEERVNVLLHQGVRLFRHDRSDDDVARIYNLVAHLASSFVFSSSSLLAQLAAS